MKELLKKILPPFLLDIYHSLRSEYREEQAELKRISTIPRYTAGSTYLFNKQSEVAFVDSASFNFMYEELFKKEIYRFRAGSSSPYIIDAGANIGLSIIWFKKNYPQAEIVAFEPDQKIFNVLKGNLHSLGLNNVELVNKALWDSETTLEFFAEGADGGRLSASDDHHRKIKVPATILSPYLKEKKVSLLKIDIEGAEYRVLKEAESMLCNVENIFIEYHSFVSREQYLAEILGILKKEGFRINIQQSGLHSNRPFMKAEVYGGMDMQLNIFGTKAENWKA